MKQQPHLSGIAKALAAHGRKGDTELIHVSKKELADLEKYGSGIGIHLTKNPATGLPEAFNWGGTLGSIGLPLAVLATIGTGGAASPWLLAAAGAAGGAGGTLLGGGSTDEALMSGLMGGIGGYGMGSVAGSLAQAGVEQAGAEAAKNIAASEIAEQGVAQIGQNAVQQMGQVGAGQATQVASNLLPQASNVLPQTGAALAEGMTPAAGSVVGGSFVPNAVPAMAPAPVLQSTPMTQMQAMGKGLEGITASPSAFGNFAMDNASNIGMTGIGALGVGSALNPQEQTITTESDSSNPYTGEMYVDPATGQMRSRAVRRAEGGEIYGDYDGVEDESRPDYWSEALALGPRRRDIGMAGGGGVSGIGALGSYSDGGRMLKGPGDGVSDSIPASIEGKRPARLADGEFVIPARAVSELGNGSTEAGSKQLYAMLDRIAAKRKKGKGLAYQANPKKLMPV